MIHLPTRGESLTLARNRGKAALGAAKELEVLFGAPQNRTTTPFTTACRKIAGKIESVVVRIYPATVPSSTAKIAWVSKLMT